MKKTGIPIAECLFFYVLRCVLVGSKIERVVKKPIIRTGTNMYTILFYQN